MIKFYTGAHHPNWLNTSPVPLFLSATTLAKYRTTGNRWPIRGTSGASWAGDSGAYAALMLAVDSDGHPWSADYERFGGMWLRFADEIGRHPDFIAIQDWPCEPAVRARTGMTVTNHQELTTSSYLQLAEDFPWLPWMPVLQGWTVDDYLRHVEEYQSAGVDLAECRRVGVGSVCRRGGQHGVASIIRALAAMGLRLHGFGVSINALRVCGHLLTSSDSQAWSANARRDRIRIQGCTHPGDCRNCSTWARKYAEMTMDVCKASARDAAAGEQLELF
jgi:hypothetical protein